jgi:hypothetical protein
MYLNQTVTAAGKAVVNITDMVKGAVTESLLAVLKQYGDEWTQPLWM